MKVLITGTSTGIGKAIAAKFLKEGHEVVGIDIKPGSILSANYLHYIADIRDKYNLPDFNWDFDIVINNAGVQNTSDEYGDDINVNLRGTIHVTEKYGIRPNIKSVLMISSASALTGAEFPLYCASKGGVNAYSKNVASRIAQYGATCNSLCPGGVLTELNSNIIDSKEKYEAVLNETMLHRWATPEEIADWAYFLTVTNKFMTAQDILVDGGEAGKFNFIS